MAQYNTIADIRKSLNGGGARPNLFEVEFPTNSLSSLPEVTPS